MLQIPNFEWYFATQDGKIYSKKSNKFLKLQQRGRYYVLYLTCYLPHFYGSKYYYWYIEKVMKGEVKVNNHESLKYYQNSIGASTEPPQRQERHRVLTTVIFG